MRMPLSCGSSVFNITTASSCVVSQFSRYRGWRPSNTSGNFTDTTATCLQQSDLFSFRKCQIPTGGCFKTHVRHTTSMPEPACPNSRGYASHHGTYFCRVSLSDRVPEQKPLF